VDEMQNDLNSYLKKYNHERTHQGRNMKGRTPYQAFLDGILKPEAEEGSMEKAA
jgi:hypothetical protein